MQQRQLGAGGPMVSAIGLGCMSFAGFFGVTDEGESHRCLAAALDLGITFWDTANVYGPGLSEQVIGNFLRRHPAPVHIATKASIRRDGPKRVDNTAAHLRAELDASLTRLGVDRIDLFYAHRRDTDVPIEDLAGTMADLIAAGKIGGYGLSEVSPGTVKRAHAVHPVRAVQNEYSLWTRLPELGLIQTCADLGVAFVPFSPLGRGVFSDAPPDPAQMAEADFRRAIPRFEQPNWSHNRRMVAGFRAFARERGWSTAGTALAWVLDQGPHLIPIPGTRTATHLAEIAEADRITLTDADRTEIARLLPVGFAYGDRYSDAQVGATERYC
jgi:aryl-alcohol dehydrogenase-like predicted oxidoreductase